MNNKRSIAFTVELLGLFILLIMVIVMITQVFVMSRSRTLEARRLNQAVMIAQSTAETASSERDPSLLAQKMQNMSNVESAEINTDNSLYIVFDTNGKSGGKDFCVSLHRSEDARDSGAYVTDQIEVYYCAAGELEDKVYELSTGRHFDGEEAGS
jgi:hypothetical protein